MDWLETERVSVKVECRLKAVEAGTMQVCG